MTGRAKYMTVGTVASVGLYSAALSADFRGTARFAVSPQWGVLDSGGGAGVEAVVPEPEPIQADVWSDFRKELSDCGEAPPETTVAFVGDVMLSRAVMSQLRAGGDWGRAFDGFRGWLTGADITVGNLETAVTDGRPVGLMEMAFRADPAAAPALAAAGFDVVSLANNHTPNFGESGLLNTFEHLSDAGVRYVGAGPDDFAAWQPVYVERNGIIFGFVAANDGDVVRSLTPPRRVMPERRSPARSGCSRRFRRHASPPTR